MVVSKTELGMQVMKDRSVSLSAQQRSALILCDGKRSAEEVVRMTVGVGVTLQDIETLEKLGLVIASDQTAFEKNSEPKQAVMAQATVSAEAAPRGAVSAGNGEFAAALNAAISLCSGLGFKGFGLNMALTGVDSLEKLQKLAPEIRNSAGDAKYKPLHAMIFGKPL